jgi:DNA-binding HxlR family transcriptional regulator
MEQKDQAILLALLKLIAASFNELQKETKMSPRILRHHLDRLLIRGLVRNEISKNWERGMPHSYSLTKKGRKEAVQTASKRLHENAKALSQSLDDYTDILKGVEDQLSDPRTLHRLRRARAFVPTQDAFDRGYMTLEEVQKARAPGDELIKPLWTVFKDLAKIIMKVDGPINASGDLDNVVFQFTKKGEPYWGVLPEVRKRDDAVPDARTLEERRRARAEIIRKALEGCAA